MFEIKDSGARQTFNSGMVRDTQDGKTLYHLVASGPMLKRWAAHLTGGAEKYDADNWMKAQGKAELKRFRESAFRHFMQWYFGERDEDHASAVYFNINGAEYVREGMQPNVNRKPNNSTVVPPKQTAAEAPGPARGYAICSSSGEASAGSVSPGREAGSSSGGDIYGSLAATNRMVERSTEVISDAAFALAGSALQRARYDFFRHECSKDHQD